MTARRAPWVLIGLLLLAAYALPLLVPPGAVPPVSAEPDASLLERLFPGVPPAWVGARLLALALGAALLAALAPAAPALRLPPPPADPPRAPAASAAAAAGLAAATALAAPFAADFSRAGEALWLLAVAGPALLLALGERRRRARRAGDRAWRAPARAGLAIGAALAGAWLAIRIPMAWHDPRTADPVDLWDAFEWLRAAIRSGENVLAGSGQPGIRQVYMLGLGITAMDAADRLPSLAQMLALHGAWLAATAALVASVAARAGGRAAAPVAAASFLASPFLLLMTHSPAPFGIFLCALAGAVALLWRIAATGSLAALTGLAALCGLAMSTAYLYAAAAIAGAAGLVLLARRAPPGRLRWAIPALAFLAAAGPMLPGPRTLLVLVDSYVSLHADFARLDAVLAGQASPLVGPDVWRAGRPGPLDVALGSLLSPFAAPRTTVRMWGDAIFDPVSACLAAVGLAACLRGARRDAGSRVLLALLAVALLPGTLTSAYDRASLTRNLGLPLVMAWLAAVGCGALLRLCAAPAADAGAAAGDPRELAGAGARASLAPWAIAAAMLASGALLFDVVTPRVLPSTARALHLEALAGGAPPGGAVLLDHGRPATLEWLEIDTIGALLPERPLPWRPWLGPHSLYDGLGEAPGVWLWSPALEADEGVRAAICARWPRAELLRLVDRAGVSTAWAARPAPDPPWTPSLPPHRYTRLSCRPGPGADGAGVDTR